MNKKLALVAVLVALLLPLLVSQASAHEIKVYAPLSYAALPPSSPTPFGLWGSFATPASFASIDQNEGKTTLNAVPNPPNPGFAISWFETGWYNYTGPTQDGSITADTWMNYLLPKWGTGVFAYLWVFEEDPVTLTFQYWTTHTGSGLPASRIQNSTFDLGIIPQTPSNIGNQFAWTTGRLYDARVLLGTVAPLGTETRTNGKFDDMLWIGYTDSPLDDWANVLFQGLRPPPTISINDTFGFTGTNIGLQGSFFQANEQFIVYYDSTPVPLVITSGTSDGSGNLYATFDIPATTFGMHAITVVGATGDSATTFFFVWVPVSPLVGDLNGDGKIDVRDIAIIAKNYGKIDPNAQATLPAVQLPPLEAGPVQQAGIGISAIALVGIGTLTFSRSKKKKKAQTNLNTQ